MRSEARRGLAAMDRLLDRLPVAARQELQDELGPIARDVQAAQRQVVAKRTGSLAAGLSYTIDAERLQARIGLLGLRKRYGAGASRLFQDLFYGRFVELGRKAQTVLVTRRLKRRVLGNGRTSKRRVVYEGKPYRLRVRAMAARPYIGPPGVVSAADQRLAGFWSRVEARLGAAT